MSIASIEIMRRHRFNQVSSGTHSQEFTSTNPVSTFGGVFDAARKYQNRDQGHQSQNQIKSGILVPVVPAGFKKGTEIDVDGKIRKVTSIGIDHEGIPILWLA